MMRAMLSPPGGTQLRGQPVSLMEVIGGARTRGEQTQRVDAYWDLCSSVADYYLGLREQEELRKFAHRYVQQVGPTGNRRKRSWPCGSARRSGRRWLRSCELPV